MAGVLAASGAGVIALMGSPFSGASNGTGYNGTGYPPPTTTTAPPTTTTAPPTTTTAPPTTTTAPRAGTAAPAPGAGPAGAVISAPTFVG